MEEENSTQHNVSSGGKARVVSAVVVVLVLAVGLIILLNKNDDKEITPASTNSSSSSGSNSQLAGPPTKDQVALHNKKDDCWTIVSGKVYNITEYVSSHPGGNEILRACGIDGTSLFETRTTSDGQKVGTGTPHSSSAHSQLSEFYVGDLAQ